MLHGSGEILRALARAPIRFKSIFRGVPFTQRAVEYCDQLAPVKDAIAPLIPSLPSDENPLERYFNGITEGPGMAKWEHYLKIYHQHFQKFRGREVHLLEIGVQSGGSLRMWRDYFGLQCHVYGIDINDACRQFEDEKTSIFIGDQADPEFWRRIKEKVPLLDIVIDDGGHEAEQQVPTFEALFEHLRPGGVYLCEDIHGVHHGFNAFVAGLYGALNSWPHDGLPQNLACRTTPLQAVVQAIHLYPFVAVVEKADRPVEWLRAVKRGSQWTAW